MKVAKIAVHFTTTTTTMILMFSGLLLRYTLSHTKLPGLDIHVIWRISSPISKNVTKSKGFPYA